MIKALDIESYKNQQTVLIVINVAVLAALFVVHIVFLFEIGTPSKLLLATLAARFVVLILELAWVQRIDDASPTAKLGRYTVFSIWLNIVFAFTASSFGGTADSHYSVLMIIPIIQAAYNFSLPKTLGVVSVAVILTILEVWIYFQRKPPIDFGEFFEAATVGLIFYVVGIVVWLLVGTLRGEQAKLGDSLLTLERTQAKLVSEEKLSAIGQLSGAIAHEIRNPVAMIASSLDLALKQPADSPLRAEMFEIATQESKRLEVLTGDFLAFARTKPPETADCDSQETVEYIGGLARARLAEHGIELLIENSSPCVLRCDASQIRQALLNLVLNAADATPSGGKVIVGFAPTATFYVENTGPAIDPKTADSIFEPFYTTKPKGTGLGLSIVKSIARAHGGDAMLAHNETGCVRFEIRLNPGIEKNGKDSDC
ncbi:MAG: HAMP domain-containing histidine kinase [Acidobacteria bacterium]|nr:HAMP domain-containing histidine kinase [Acidobacteriota bacterium]